MLSSGRRSQRNGPSFRDHQHTLIIPDVPVVGRPLRHCRQKCPRQHVVTKRRGVDVRRRLKRGPFHGCFTKGEALYGPPDRTPPPSCFRRTTAFGEKPNCANSRSQLVPNCSEAAPPSCRPGLPPSQLSRLRVFRAVPTRRCSPCPRIPSQAPQGLTPRSSSTGIPSLP